MITVLSLSLILVPSLVILIWIKNSKIRNAVNKFPGPPTAPLFGNALQIGRQRAELHRQMTKWASEYKEGVYRMWLGPNPVINVYKADLLECIMSTSNAKKSIFYKLLRPWLKDGLLMSFGSKWQKRRKMLTPTFHYSILEDFMSVFQQQSAKLVRILSERAEGGEFDIYPYITKCALDVICLTAMGVDLNSQEKESTYVDAIYSISELILERIARPWLFHDPIYNLTERGREHRKALTILHDFTLQVIQDRWKEYEKKLQRGEKIDGEQFDIYGKRKRLAFLDLLIQNSMADKSMSIKDIQEEVDTFMFEGHDTTSSAIGWSIYNLGKHPDWQERIRDEVLRYADNGNPLTMKVISEMKLLDAFLKESIRLYATVPFFSREITDECKIGPYHCPKGVTVEILTSVLHRDPEYFPDPEKFDPERWMGEDITKRHPFCYVPFSSGLRNCIGQKFALLEWKTVVISLIKNFQISCDHDLSDIKDHSGELIMRPTHGVPIKLTKVQ